MGSKGIYLLCTAILLLSFTNPSDVVSFFSKGQWQSIAAACGTRTHLEYNGHKGLYTAQEMGLTLRDFITYYPPQSCISIQNHESKGQSRYMKLKYVSPQKTFILDLYLVSNTKHQIEISSIIIQPKI